MPDSVPPPVATAPEQAPKVDGPIANSAVGIGWAVAKLATSLTGDGGIRVLALAGAASITFLGYAAIDREMAKQAQTEGLMIRTGEDRLEREKADNSRREKDMRDWMAAEMEKQRTSFASNVAFVSKSFAEESEKNRAMIFKLAGARLPGQAPDEFPTFIPLSK